MMDSEVDDAIRRRVSRLGTRDLRRVAAGTVSGQRVVEVISREAETDVGRSRARRLAMSYLPWVLVATVIVLLVGAQLPRVLGNGDGGATVRPIPDTAVVEGVGHAGVEVFKTRDGVTWMYLHNPPAVVEVNGVPFKFESNLGWVRLKLGEVNEVMVARDGRVDRFVWTETGWQKE